MPSNRDRNYERIRAVGVDLFARQGYWATGIRDIAREADTTSSTLYHYVANKEELLVAIMRDGFQSLIEQATAGVEGLPTPEAKLATLVHQHVLFEMHERQLAKVMTVEFRFLGPTAREQVVPLRDGYERVWGDVIEEGVREGVFAVRDTQMARLGLLQMCAAPSQWRWPDRLSRPEEIAETFAGIALRVVSPELPPATAN